MRLGGVDLRDATLESLRRRIVFLPQEGHLFSGTLADNVRLALPEASDEEVAEALAGSARSRASRRCRTGSRPTCGRAASGSPRASASSSASPASRSPTRR